MSPGGLLWGLLCISSTRCLARPRRESSRHRAVPPRQIRGGGGGLDPALPEPTLNRSDGDQRYRDETTRNPDPARPDPISGGACTLT